MRKFMYHYFRIGIKIGHIRDKSIVIGATIYWEAQNINQNEEMNKEKK